MKKYCTRCGRQFEAVGREVICPECKAHAAEDAKRAAVLKAKRASWAGESIPVRISGRASTVIREYGAAHNVPFAQALDDLLKASPFFISMGTAWEEVTPYKSRRMQKSTDAPQDKPQDAPQDVQAAKITSKSSSKTASKAAKKAVKTAKTAKTAK